MGFWGLVQFLSRLPGKSESPERLARSLGLLPGVGLFLGLLLGLAGWIEFSYLPVPAAVALLLLTFFALKGILHLDGLADLADAAMVAGTPEDRQRVLRDPHHGTAGILAIGLFLVGLVLLLLAPGPIHPILPIPSLGVPRLDSHLGVLLLLILAEVNAVSAMLVVLAAGTPSPSSVLARPFSESLTRGTFVAAMLVTGAITLLLGGWMLLATAGALVVGGWLAAWARPRLGGISGDVLGAAYCITFLLTLFLSVALQVRL